MSWGKEGLARLAGSDERPLEDLQMVRCKVSCPPPLNQAATPHGSIQAGTARAMCSDVQRCSSDRDGN